MIPCPIKSPCRITQRFGCNPAVYRQFGLNGHNGVDITGENKGELVDIFSPFDGLVWKVGNHGTTGYGKHVILLAGPGGDGAMREVVFGHMSAISVKQGDRVYLYDKLGKMGDTGFSTGPHLHLGIRKRKQDDLTILSYENGYKGWFDFLPFLIPVIGDWDGMFIDSPSA